MATTTTLPKTTLGSRLTLIFGALLGVAEQTIPIFIHNPKSQQIEGVVVTEGNNLFETLAAILTGQNLPPAA